MIYVEQVRDGDFKVIVDGLDFDVHLDENYYRKLTSGKISKEELIKKSFEFLLEREPKDDILRTFNLEVIKKHFPEYESVIRKF